MAFISERGRDEITTISRGEPEMGPGGPYHSPGYGTVAEYRR